MLVLLNAGILVDFLAIHLDPLVKSYNNRESKRWLRKAATTSNPMITFLFCLPLNDHIILYSIIHTVF
jgi:hypothetical protein